MSERLLVLAALLTVASSASGQTLAQRIDRQLDAPGMDHMFWGVAISDAAGHAIYQRNADRLFIPASNAKLVVATVATALLGADFTVATTVYATGPVAGDSVRGDLVLYGRGDPTFSSHCYHADTTVAGACDRDPSAKLRELAQQLRARGIRIVTGDLVGDGSYFDAQLVHPAWQNYDLGWWYAAPVSGLSFNDNSIDVREIASDSAGAAARLLVSPDLGGFTFDNHATVAARGQPRTFDIFRNSDGLGYVATGQLVAGAAPRKEAVAVLDPNRYAALAFRAALRDAGIEVRGTVRSTTDPLAYPGIDHSTALATVRSRPLRDWIYPLLSVSQNWFAEMILKQLGKTIGHAGSWSEGRRIERRFLIDSVGVDSTEFSLQDGSGLGANNLVAPIVFTRLLTWARARGSFDVIRDALPQSGKPGSLRDRFVGTPAAQAVRAKTGSVTGVNALSGYVERADGSVLVFSIIANHHLMTSAKMQSVIDGVVGMLAKP